jgi:hypothetical protein
MEAGVEHFSKVLKSAYELPLTGMSVSLIYTLSHAHIEGAAQIRRWGKAEATVLKLKEIAEYADTHAIPHSIPTVAHQLHLWWREKHANLYSRQVRTAVAQSAALKHLPVPAPCRSLQPLFWLCWAAMYTHHALGFCKPSTCMLLPRARSACSVFAVHGTAAVPFPAILIAAKQRFCISVVRRNSDNSTTLPKQVTLVLHPVSPTTLQ